MALDPVLINRVIEESNTPTQKLEELEQEIPTNYSSNLPSIQIMKGTLNIYYYIEKLIENAKNTVYIVTTLEDLSKMYHTNIPEKIKTCVKNGGEVRLLTEVSSDEFLPLISRFGATEARIGKLSSKRRMIVEQGSQMIMSNFVLNDSDQTNVESDNAIWTNSRKMINNIFILCNLWWDNYKTHKNSKNSLPYDTNNYKTHKNSKNSLPYDTIPITF